MSLESSLFFLFIPGKCTGTISLMLLVMGKIFNSSSIAIQVIHLAKLKINLSLNLGLTYECPSVLYLPCTSILNSYNCFKEVNVLNNMTITPPPSTVSMALHSTLGVMDSKS